MMDVKFDKEMCVICRINVNSSDKEISEVSKGVQSLIDYSAKYNNLELYQYLLTKPKSVLVHNHCRRNYVNKRKLISYEQKNKGKENKETEDVQPKQLRSSIPLFDWKTHCFFCTKECSECRQKLRYAATLELRENVLRECMKRNDTWGLSVQGRLETCCDLVAEEAVYHVDCHRTFFRISSCTSPGRPNDLLKKETFEKLCSWLELNDFELISLKDLCSKAHEFASDSSFVYSEPYLKQKLIERYGNHIQFNRVQGRKNVICWRNMAEYIVNQKWYENQKHDKSENIVITAAKLLKTAIREADYSMENYPVCDDVKDPKRVREWMPNLLCLFLDNLINSESKKAGIGHSIVQAVRPKSVIAVLKFK